jgi:hypothetical protein
VHSVRGYWKKDGTYVRRHLARNPGRRSASGGPSRRTGRAGLTGRHKTVALTVAVAGVFTVGLGLEIAGPPWSSDPPTATAGTIDPASAESSTEITLSLNRTETALIAIGFGGTFNVKFDKDCAQNSYGQVHKFFLLEQCRWLARESLTLEAASHPVALVAISWVEMPSAVQADQYKRLVDTQGTGNITELTRIEGPYQSVRYSGQYYVSGRYGTAVWNCEVQPISQLSASTTKKILLSSRQ